ncbi:MAG TPA: hypothetical protein VFT09_09310 [Ilumatobacteraceae bacterium]|nr:hypothetical protein [Ilumatobacteraceae bacterium]
MSEESMIALVQDALAELGVDDRVLAAGEFAPRGHSGSAFVGGLLGSEAGSFAGNIGEAAGIVAGSVAAQRYADAGSGLPSSMIIGVSATTVYGFAGRRSHLDSGIVFRLPRDTLTAEVHQRVNVRVLELVDGSSGSRLELEGNRLPVTHRKDVIEILR